jgi:cell division protein FtsI/penicillin-binding protein 2
MSVRRGTALQRRTAGLLIGSLALAACSAQPTISPTPYPTPAPTLSPASASLVAGAFLAAWQSDSYEGMWELLAPADQATYGHDRFVGLFSQFASLVRVTKITYSTGPLMATSIAPGPAQPDLLPSATPTPTPPSASGGATGSASTASAVASAGIGTAAPLASSAASAAPPSAAATASASPSTAPSLGPAVAGPVPALAVDARIDITTDLLGDLGLDRRVVMVQGASDWQVRWSPAWLFPELGSDGSLALTRQTSPRGRIESANGTVFAETRADGMRVYPQEYLAGQAIGYVSRVTSADMKTLAAKGYEVGDWVGRSGLEQGADDLLRGSPGFTLEAVRPGQEPVAVLTRPMVPGANLTITLQPKLQRAAEAAMARYPRVASAAIDPRSGDVWVLASLPRFDPNAMTLGTTLKGVKLPRPSSEQIIDKAVLGTYPAGSDFKPFTLGAALQTGTVKTTDRMLCPSTWTYSGFTFQNWMRESLPGLRTWTDTMALSCNTTYMPLSIRLYGKSKTALTDLISSFGFGEVTGIPFLPEAAGVLPDAAYFKTHKRWNGQYSPYGPFDQIQLAIGQGSYLGTPLQLATAYAAWGNRGVLWVPHIVSRATLPDGTVVYQSRPTYHHIIPLRKSVMDYVVSTMRAVVTSPLGTAYRAFLGFPIAAAGKSGTAETGGPDPDAWFPGFAPMNNPTIAVATVVVTVPLGNGGDFAAPITRAVMEAHFFR